MSVSFDSFSERYAFRLHSKCYKVSVPSAYRTMGVLKFDRQSDFLVAVERAYWQLSGLMFVGHICHATATPSPSPATGMKRKAPSVERQSLMTVNPFSRMRPRHARGITRRMANRVNDDFGFGRFVEDQIGIRQRHHAPYGRIIGAPADAGMQQ